jgi:hypothetical protein
LVQGRGPVGHVERADVGARRDDRVDLVGGGVDDVDPASSALRMMRIESSWSGLPMAPNIIAPSA